MIPSFKGIVLAATLAGAGLAGVAQASAMPLGASAGASAPIEQAAPLVKVAWGCGPGWHPNPWGRCVPNHYWGGGWGRPGWGYRRHWRRW